MLSKIRIHPDFDSEFCSNWARITFDLSDDQFQAHFQRLMFASRGKQTGFICENKIPYVILDGEDYEYTAG